VRAFIPNLEDGLSTRFLYHNLPAKSDVRDEMDEAMAEAFNDVYTHYRHQLTGIWKELRQFDGKSDEELPRLMLSDAQRALINDYYRQMVSFIALTQPDKDLRAPILRTRLNLYRMLMIVAVLRRHEAMGTAEGLFEEKVFTTTEEDLRWGLAYIFYCMMQTSAIYNRLRREVKEEVPSRVYISALAFLTLLPKQFTTAAANEIGKEQGIKERAVALHLRSLYQKGYITRLKQGVYCKVARETKKYRHAA
jgi:DNA-binding transcriptional ArsR family regulator